MYCTRCGRKQVDNAKFCYSCGAKIFIPDQENSVPVQKGVKSVERISYNAEKDPYDYDIDDLFDIGDEMPTEKPIAIKRKKANDFSIEHIIGIIVTIVAVVIVITIASLSIAVNNKQNNSERYASSSTDNYTNTESSKKSSGSSSHTGSSKKSNDSSTNTCSMCGRSWKAGDSGGNFMSITLRNMCVSCYKNYQDMQNLKEALEASGYYQ